MTVGELLVAAIEGRRLVEFRYGGHARRVMPAVLGVSDTGTEVLHAYQVGGGSRRGGLPQWRNFATAGMTDPVLLDDVFAADPPGLGELPWLAVTLARLR